MASSKVEICRVDMRPGSLKDNYFTLYEDGSVKREYDENDWQYNLTDWLEVKNLDAATKQAMLKAAKPENKAKAAELLSLPLPE